ncbi:MAG TPA: hypothetical protein VN442_20650 [Bryobacteraceae bacterium]|nr:hypothetical protein [Bryobacteraceae bacterium]
MPRLNELRLRIGIQGERRLPGYQGLGNIAVKQDTDLRHVIGEEEKVAEPCRQQLGA